VPHDQQPAVLARLLDVLKSLFELLGVNAGRLASLAGLRERSPAAFVSGGG